MNETPVTIVGNVVTDLRARRIGEGQRMVSFRLASSERRFDRASGEWTDGDRLYVTVVCWRNLANGVAMSLAKGDPVVVTGRIYTREYEVEGQKKSATEVVATSIGPDLSRCYAEVKRVRRGSVESTSPSASPAETAPMPDGADEALRPRAEGAEAPPTVDLTELDPERMDQPGHAARDVLGDGAAIRPNTGPLIPVQGTDGESEAAPWSVVGASS